ncbi:MAG: ABC transporter ATP-binding protein [Halanaerobiales bacterium]
MKKESKERIIGIFSLLKQLWINMPILTTVWFIMPIIIGILVVPVYNAQKDLIDLMIENLTIYSWQELLKMALPSLILFTSVFILQAILDVFSRWLNLNLKEKATLDIQGKIIDIASNIPYSKYDDKSFYDKMIRARQVLGDDLIGILRNIIMAIRIIATMLGSIWIVYSSGYWYATVIIVITLLINVFLKLRVEIKVRRLNRDMTGEGRMADYLNNILKEEQIIRDLRLFASLEYFLDKWSNLIIGQHKKRYGARRGEIKTGGIVSIIHATAIFLIMNILIANLRNDQVTVGLITVVFLALLNSGSQITTLTWPLSKLFMYGAKLINLLDFLDMKKEIDKGDLDLYKPEELNEIQFKNVNFSYPNSDGLILNNLSFSIKRGEKIALVGENGSGKTTLVKLLLGFYKAESGDIYWNNQRTESQDILGECSVVLQNFNKYNMTLRENVAFGCLEKMDNDQLIINALKRCGLNSLIEELGSLDEPLGRLLEGGRQLSGGQWQKISLARAIMKDTPLVILDEPTAALDPNAELEMFNQFKDVCENKTAIFISHRMGWARYADRILVMKNGSIIEEGSHEQLMQLEGEYAKTFNLQSSWYK